MILTRNRSLRSRMGFTLVELMVAAALAITIMWILAESFKMGIDFARSARSTGDMMTQLNNAGQIMLRDLQAPHFASGPGNNNGQLSMVFADQIGSSGPATAYTGYTPPAGYFQIVSPPPTALLTDDFADGFQLSTTAGPPIPANPPGASLAFTVFLAQGMPQNQFVATVSGQTFASRAAEVAYFLEAQQPPAATQTDSVTVTTDLTQDQPNLVATPQPLYTLYRRQRLVMIPTDNQLLTPNMPQITPGNPQYDPYAGDVISYSILDMPKQLGGVQYMPNTLASFATAYSWQVNLNGKGPPRYHYQPASRFGIQSNRPTLPNPPVPLQAIQPVSPRFGDDILLSNVLSFEVQAIWTPSPTITAPNTTPILAPRPYTVKNAMQANPAAKGYPTYPTSSLRPYNSNYPFDNFSTLTTFNQQLPYTFDTWYQLNDSNNPGISWNNFANSGANFNLMPMPIRISALQFTVRIYDPKTKQSRQNTWRVAM